MVLELLGRRVPMPLRDLPQNIL